MSSDTIIRVVPEETIVHTESSSPEPSAERSGDDASDALHNIRAAPEEPIVHTESSSPEPSAERSGDDASDAYSGPAADSVAQAEITAYPTYVHEFFSRMTFPHGRLGHTLSFETHEQLLRNSLKPYEGPKNANVFIFHLPSDFDNFTLYLLFRKFGDLISARVMVNLHTGASRGYGFVSFTDERSAKLAVQYMDGFSIGRKRLKVAIKKHKKHCKSHSGRTAPRVQQQQQQQQQQLVAASSTSKKASNADTD